VPGTDFSGIVRKIGDKVHFRPADACRSVGWLLHLAPLPPSAALSLSADLCRTLPPSTALCRPLLRFTALYRSLPLSVALVGCTRRCVPASCPAHKHAHTHTVGKQVVNVKVGESVFGRQTMERMMQGRGGACGEWCVVDSADIAPKPTNITHEHAAAVPTAGLVAYAALRCGDLPEGEEGEEDGERRAKVAILGGSGGIGSFALQVPRPPPPFCQDLDPEPSTLRPIE